jgi:hypothetical protein
MDLIYFVDKVMGSTQKHRRDLYVVKWKSWPVNKYWIREPSDSFYLVGTKEELRVFHSKNCDAPWDSHLTFSKSVGSLWIFLFTRRG